MSDTTTSDEAIAARGPFTVGGSPRATTAPGGAVVEEKENV